VQKKRRTDLALEARELWRESAAQNTALNGVKARDGQREGFPVTTVEILNEEGEQALGKNRGTYITLTLDALLHREEDAFGRGARAIAAELDALLQDFPQDAPVLVVGLGNRAITPDAIGPKVHDHTMVTRHLVAQMPEHFGTFRPVASLSTGVLGTTGMESGELVEAAVQKLHPACVIAVDALAARSLNRVCRTVQLADTGITPGSGVGNHRRALNRDSLGVTVIAIGVPTVVDGATLAADLIGSDDLPDLGAGRDMLVTPKDIDSQVADLSKVIGYGINLALHPGLTVEDVDLFLS